MYVKIHLRTHVCLHVCRDVWLYGWMDTDGMYAYMALCMHAWIDRLMDDTSVD